ncbi:SIP domain-containing protein [Paracoccus sp. 08]|uniref:SIP domain-containing protein n=1 Tax=Paracoccus sp. 08 TaxID=2606624 RepID=UPI0020943DE4|nr:SIP domain-containing protein [Paracoccus sp. 08]MCO6363033.1 siderophore-interacting protein [Paracoccus sp. 08]
MSHLRSHHGTGLIPRASGAAVAALKARAAMWEAPLVEDEAGLSLLIWGAELRLTRQADALRIDLLAPEDRLVGILRDSATEILAEAGVEVAWDDVDAGALAPGLALLRVAGVSRPVPGFLRVRLAGPQAGQFAQGGYHFRLLLPPAGRAAIWPRVAASGRTVWPDGAITRMLAETRGTASAVLCCDAADLGALADDPRVTRCDDLMAALVAMPDPAGGHVWFAADAARARAARSHLLARGLTKTQFTAAAYWSRAEA